MLRLLALIGTTALTVMIAAPGPASAAERRADGVRINDQAAQTTDMSSRRRAVRRSHAVRRVPGGARYNYWAGVPGMVVWWW